MKIRILLYTAYSLFIVSQTSSLSFGAENKLTSVLRFIPIVGEVIGPKSNYTRAGTMEQRLYESALKRGEKSHARIKANLNNAGALGTWKGVCLMHSPFSGQREALSVYTEKTKNGLSILTKVMTNVDEKTQELITLEESPDKKSFAVWALSGAPASYKPSSVIQLTAGDAFFSQKDRIETSSTLTLIKNSALGKTEKNQTAQILIRDPHGRILKELAIFPARTEDTTHSVLLHRSQLQFYQSYGSRFKGNHEGYINSIASNSPPGWAMTDSQHMQLYNEKTSSAFFAYFKVQNQAGITLGEMPDGFSFGQDSPAHEWSHENSLQLIKKPSHWFCRLVPEAQFPPAYFFRARLKNELQMNTPLD